MTLHFRDWRYVASLRPRNRAEITIPMYKQKPYPVWLSFGRHSNMSIPIPKPASDTGIKTKLNARMPIRQGADLFEANIPANKISLPLRKANFLTLEIRQERTSRFYLRIEWTTAFKGFY